MLTIRLSRAGRKKLPFFRIVLTEHTKPADAGYKEVLGTYEPMSHTTTLDVEKMKEYISKGAKPSERVAKLAEKHTKDSFFAKFYVKRTVTSKTKNPDKYTQ